LKITSGHFRWLDLFMRHSVRIALALRWIFFIYMLIFRIMVLCKYCKISILNHIFVHFNLTSWNLNSFFFFFKSHLPSLSLPFFTEFDYSDKPFSQTKPKPTRQQQAQITGEFSWYNMPPSTKYLHIER